MKRFSILLAAAAVLGLSAAASAGEGHCTASTQECLDKMATHCARTGWAGLEGAWNEEDGLLTVSSVVAKSPAAEAGLMKGDVVVGLNGHRFADMSDEDWKASEAERVPGATANYMIKRDGHEQEIAVVLAKMPEDVVAAKLGHHMMEHAQVASVQ